jgi:hypothetical protein
MSRSARRGVKVQGTRIDGEPARRFVASQHHSAPALRSVRHESPLGVVCNRRVNVAGPGAVRLTVGLVPRKSGDWPVAAGALRPRRRPLPAARSTSPLARRSTGSRMTLTRSPTAAAQAASQAAGSGRAAATSARPAAPRRSAAEAQRQTRAYAAHPGLAARLEHALARVFPQLGDAVFDWLVPAASAAPTNPRAQRELRDAAFWATVERPDLEAYARDWWPDGGPAWDAIAIANLPSGRVVVLIDTTTATQPATPTVVPAAASTTDPRAAALIDAALLCTHDRLNATAPADAWLSTHRHLARRLTWADWLRDHRQPALLAQVGFAGTSHTRTAEAAATAVANAHLDALGVDPQAVREWCAPVVVAGV